MSVIARRNAAKAQKKVAQAMAGVGEADNAFAAIKSFEENVAKEEAAALAYDSIAAGTEGNLKDEFAELEAGIVDTELDALRREMGK